MKVLYVASNPDAGTTLRLEQEITELQRNALATSGESVEFVFLPSLPFEDLPSQISKHKPDIVHISAHGDEGSLAMAREDQRLVPLTAEMLCAFLDVDQAPRLVYLNACDSAPIARELVKRVPMAIGTTAPITNRAARKAAVAFYTRLLEGKSVQSAFETGRMIMKGLDSAATSSELFCRDGCDAKSQRLHNATRIVACFPGDVPRAADGRYKFELGLVGCPRHTKQIIFFTDDESFGDDGYSVVGGTVVRGEMWLEEGDFWEACGDFRLFACGITAGGDHYSVGGQLCTALETYYELHSSVSTPTVVTAIARLRSMDGTSGSDRAPIVPGKAPLTTVSRRGMSRPPSDPKIKPHAKGRKN